MGQVRLNPDQWSEFKGTKSLSVIAAELDLDKATVSRVDTGNSLPGNKFIANVLLRLPVSFATFFLTEEDAEQ